MRSLLFIFISGVLILSACRKEELPENRVGNAVFYLTGEIDGETRNFIAGDDGFYMYTDTYTSTGLYVLEGNLSNDEESVIVQFFRAPQNNSLLEKREYEWLNFNQLIQQVYVDSLSESAIVSLEWNINGVTYQQVNIDTLLDEPGKYEICLTINYNNNCSQNICSDYMIGMSDTYDMDFNYKIFQDSSVQCIPQIVSSSEVDELEWYFGGAFIQESGILQQQLTPGIHTVDMVVKFKDGLELKKSKNIRFQSQDCFFEEVRIEGNPEFQVEEGVVITYIDANGKEFKSVNAVQANDHSFFLIDLENYKQNQQQQQVKKLTTQFNVTLKATDGSGELRTLTNFNGKFGVAHL